ncbi:hypothetical protein GGX14DRAFT_606888 [Mycena pura]|uniref:Uncharacterized protein n=1 Tax=Mycena pura TaxID=153505 RepID=A0AAD6YGI0_9AGAR|nr:hypothetical protein GGX14DRAFT_606888 [Mycena pura]
MRFSFPSRARYKVSSAGSSKPKPGKRGALPDVVRTSLYALKESADAFPPLKSAVGGVIVVWEIADRAKNSKANAREIAMRTKEIVDVVADAVPDPSAISPPMLQSIERFTVLLDEIRCRLEAIALTSTVSRLVHLNSDERALQRIKAQLDDAYRDLVAASALRVEVQSTKISVQQAQTQRDITKISATTFVFVSAGWRLLCAREAASQGKHAA